MKIAGRQFSPGVNLWPSVNGQMQSYDRFSAAGTSSAIDMIGLVCIFYGFLGISRYIKMIRLSVLRKRLNLNFATAFLQFTSI